jgi:hypothetical protein
LEICESRRDVHVAVAGVDADTRPSRVRAADLGLQPLCLVRHLEQADPGEGRNRAKRPVYRTKDGLCGLPAHVLRRSREQVEVDPVIDALRSGREGLEIVA